MNVNEKSGKSLKEISGKNTCGLRDLFFLWSSTKIQEKIPLSLVFNQFDIVTANFLAAQGVASVERL